VDLVTITKNAAALAMNIAGNAKTSAVIYSSENRAFDWSSDETTPSGGTQSSVEGVLYDLKQAKGEGATSWRTEFLVEGVKVPAGIEAAARIEIGSDKWNIANVEKVPTGAVVIFGLRK
jgi:hypothetical protein